MGERVRDTGGGEKGIEEKKKLGERVRCASATDFHSHYYCNVTMLPVPRLSTRQARTLPD